MALNDPLSNALSAILNGERVGKTEVTVKPMSKLIKDVLGLLKDSHYVGDFAEIEDGRGNHLVVNLLGKVNRCGAVRPRYPVAVADYERFEKRYLPAKDFGILIISTPAGLMAHTEAKRKKTGGRLLAYCY
jgi:small subunit ribosomal protein S8